MFRQAPGSGDNSGDYGTYPDTAEIIAGDVTAFLRGIVGRYALAVWTDGACACSPPLGALEEEWRGILGR